MPARLGGPVLESWSGPEDWAAKVLERGYRAAPSPVGPGASDDEALAYAAEASRRDILISEVGAWSNPMSPDAETRRAALERCKLALHLADLMGAGCAVNIAGARAEAWDAPHPDNYHPDTFDAIVETVREIVDAVKPTRSVYALEMMPYMLPDGPDAYVRMIHAIDRQGFGVHLDPVNIVNSTERYYRNGALIDECFDKLGPWLRNCHCKDIQIRHKLTLHLDEVIPGEGELDYVTFLKRASAMPCEVGLILEHLSTEAEYRQAAHHLRSVAQAVGVDV